MDEKLREFLGTRSGVHVGQVEIGMGELHDAIAAAERLLSDKHIFNNVEISGDKKQCADFAKDVIAVAQMLSKLAKCITESQPLQSGEVN